MQIPPAGNADLPLAHQTLHLAGRGAATDYATALLESLGAAVTLSNGPDDPTAAIAWARSGLMALTGLADGPAQMCPAPLASCADGVVKALGSLASPASADRLPAGYALLGERAALAGLHRKGIISPGGGCRLLAGADGWFAINLARAADWADVPAWLEYERVDSWEAITAAVATRAIEPLVARARLLGLAACVSAPPAGILRPWYTASRHGAAAPIDRRSHPPRVVDLSSLWAGPLCSHLLQQLGAQVIKVESLGRPDGARGGPPEFFDLLNQGKRSVAFTFDDHGIGQLHALLNWADIVIEASRPRALRQLGVLAEQCIARRRGLTWISLTGYGRDDPGGSWAAFGDDGAIAAGLSALMQQLTGLPLVCGDAIADPLTGMHAAVAALASHRSGGGRLVCLALRDVVAHCIGFARPVSDVALRERWQAWATEARSLGIDETRPTARPAAAPARALGADNNSALAGRGSRC